ncbi:MAG: Nucleoid occlusion factor SlmA [Turneriella sp.]|nr:Nucleoid occlusion factor SlmA [Turneriella sp.]
MYSVYRYVSVVAVVPPKKKQKTMPEKILSTALELYLSNGISAVSMRRIAQKLHITAMALYRHFPNKDAILLALVEQGFTVFGEYQYRALAGKTAAERLLLAGKAFVDFVVENPKIFRLIFMSPDIFQKVHNEGSVGIRAHQTYQFLLDRVADGMREGFLKEGTNEEVARAIWGLCHGMASLYVIGMLDVQESEFRAMFMSAFLQMGSGILVDATLEKFTV